MKEKRLYPVIKRYLENKGYTCHSYSKKGKEIDFITAGVSQVIMDVFGLKRTSKSRDNFDLEVIGVEVKPYEWEGPIPLRVMYQALAYSRIAHRCYLAVPKEIMEQDKINAADLGIGLMKIKGNKVEIVTYAKRMEPNLEYINQLLSKFDIVKCGFCSCYKFKYSKEEKEGGGSWRDDFFSNDYKWIWVCSGCYKKIATIARTKITNEIWGEIFDLQKRLNKKIAKKHSKSDAQYIWDEIERIKKRMKKERNIDYDYYTWEIGRIKKMIKKLKNRIS